MLYIDLNTFRVQFASSAVDIQLTVEKAALEGMIKDYRSSLVDLLGSVFGGRAIFPFRLYVNGKRCIAFKGFYGPEKVPIYLS